MTVQPEIVQAKVTELEALLQRLWDTTTDKVDRDVDDPLREYFTHVTYTLPGGWKMVVFVDAGDWDYVDHFIAPDGTKLDPDDVPKPPGDENAIWHPVFLWSPRVEDPRWGRFSGWGDAS